MLLLLQVALSATSAVAPKTQLDVMDSMRRHDAYAPLSHGRDTSSGDTHTTVTITAAGREKESAQFLLRSQTNRTVRVAVAPPASLPAGTVRVQRLGFVWATNETSDSKQSRTFPMRCPEAELRRGGCWVADPLLPIVNSTLFLPSGLTVSLWVTFAAPASPEFHGSTHTASLTVAGHTVILQLVVRRFSLPLTPALKNTVQLDVAHLHRCFPTDTEDETNRRYEQYALFALRELRLNPGSIYDSWRRPGAAPCRFHDYQSCFNTSAATLARWVHEEGLNAFTIPSSPMNQTRSFVADLRRHKISHLANFYGFDEFNGPMSSIASSFAPLKDAFPEITTLTTAHIGYQYVACCPGLVKTPVPFSTQAMEALAVDAVTPQTNYLPPVANISTVQRSGKEVWTYISVQPYKPYGDWRLDNPLIDNRALFWLVGAFGFDGLLHWGLNQWGGDSALIPIQNSSNGLIPPAHWNMATSEGSWMQGDGKLLYCGESEPVPSSRLINIRDGMEDYDYLRLALAVDGAAARAVLGRVSDGKCADCAERNVSVVRRAREDLATIIEEGQLGV